MANIGKAITAKGQLVLLSEIPCPRSPKLQWAWLCDSEHNVIFPNKVIAVESYGLTRGVTAS